MFRLETEILLHYRGVGVGLDRMCTHLRGLEHREGLHADNTL